MSNVFTFCFALLLLSFAHAEAQEDLLTSPLEVRLRSSRIAMVADQLRSRGISDPKVLEAMSRVERHLFLDPELEPVAYEDRPLPIGHGQTISQPYIVAYMSELLRPKEGYKLLEVGTGSGYQAAVLAEIVDRVYTIEIIPELAEEARSRLAELGYQNIEVRVGDGFYGWPEAAPFDGIIVTAAAESIPQPLVDQMKEGGRMVIPIGENPFTQRLVLVEKDEEGNVHSRDVLPVRFVPLTGEH